MKDSIIRKLFLGFIQIHVLYHAGKEPIFGLSMIEELNACCFNVKEFIEYYVIISKS